VVVGLTDLDVSPVTVPTPLSMLRDVAPVTEKDSVLDCPLVILVGPAVKLLITGAAAVTVTVTVFVVEPPLFVAVSV
jgi:hypothetical protein